MLLATAAPPPAMIQPVPGGRDLSEMLLRAARGLEDRRLGLADFIRQAWPVVEPRQPYVASWHSELIAEHVEAALRGEITRLVINAPPRSGKSLPAVVFAPAWDWTRDPSRRYITVSYSQDLATKHNVERRGVIRSDWYQARWGGRFQLAGDQDVKREFSNTERGHMVARGTGAGITGYGADVILVDDPLNPELAESELERRAVRDYYDRTLYSRLDDKRRGTIVLVEQRLHARDLTDHLLSQKHEGWVHLCLPAEAPARRTYVFPVSGREVAVEAGAPLCPEREGAEVLARTRASVGSRRYGAQWLQSPSAEEGNLFKRDRWGVWRRLPERFDEVAQSWDMTFKDTDGTDFVVGQVWGLLGRQLYLLDQARGRLSFNGTVEAVRSLSSRWPAAVRKLVEAKANGDAVCDFLRREVGGFVLVEPRGGKLARAYAAQPRQEAGDLLVPDPAAYPWVEEFVSECADFPDGDHDDQVDAMTQLVNYYGAARPGWRPG